MVTELALLSLLDALNSWDHSWSLVASEMLG